MGDRALDQHPFFQMFNPHQPRIAQQLADGKPNPLAFLIDTDHLDINFLSYAQNFVGVLDAIPGNL